MTSLRIRPLHTLIVGASALALLAAEMIAMTPRADAAHHLVRIRQVYTNGAGMQEFVVLQLTGANENQLFTVGPASVQLYDGTMLTHTQEFAANPPNGENQRTVLAATTAAETAFGVQADLEFGDGNYLNDAAGAACLRSNAFPDIDCVEWGTGTVAALPSATGTLEAAIPAGMMLERSIAPGCATFFETADDTNDSAADFAPATIPAMGALRNNAAAIQETACVPPGGTFTPPGNPTSPINPAGHVRKRKCKKKQKGAAAAKKKKCKKR